MKFSVIVGDYPWSFSDGLKMDSVKRGASSNYKTISNDELKKLSITDLCEDDSVFALWCPSSLISFGIEAIKNNGFRLTQSNIWCKTKKDPLINLKKSIKDAIIKNDLNSIDKLFEVFDINDIVSCYMGRLFRQTHEICLLGVKGKHIYKQLKNKSQRSVHFAPNLEHSAKPPILQDRLELMFPEAKKLELFARRPRDGWVCVGNELVSTNTNDSPFGEDIFDSIKRLKDL